MTKDYFWALVTLIIAIVLAILLLLVFRDDEPAAQGGLPHTKELYQGVPFDAKLLPLDRRALDEAYHAHLLLLFSVWLKDQAGDPSRFNNGLRIARRAYHEAVQKIEAREKQLKEQQK